MYKEDKIWWLEAPEDVKTAVEDPDVDWLDCRMEPTIENMENWFVPETAGISFNLPVAHLGFDNVKEMRSCFKRLPTFDQPFPKGLFQNIEKLDTVLYGLKRFNSDISGLIGPKTIIIEYSITGLSAFNHPLDELDLSSVALMKQCFRFNPVFNQNINHLDFANLGIMLWSFTALDSFNKPLTDMRFPSLINFSFNFAFLSSYNLPIRNLEFPRLARCRGFLYELDEFDSEVSDIDFPMLRGMELSFIRLDKFNSKITNIYMPEVKYFIGVMCLLNRFDNDLSGIQIPKIENLEWFLYDTDISVNKAMTLKLPESASFRCSMNSGRMSFYPISQNPSLECFTEVEFEEEEVLSRDDMGWGFFYCMDVVYDDNDGGVIMDPRYDPISRLRIFGLGDYIDKFLEFLMSDPLITEDLINKFIEKLLINSQIKEINKS